MRKIWDLLFRYQLILVLLALIVGVSSPRFFLPLNPYNGLFLQIILFATGLQLNLTEFVREAGDWRMMTIANGMKLVGLPLLVAIPLAIFAPNWMIPFILAACMPTGLTAPAVVSMLRGRTSLAVLISVSTSLIAPFLVPLILRIVAGQQVTIDTIGMMVDIAWVVIVPLLLAILIQWRAGTQRIARYADAVRGLGVIGFVLIIASVSASSVGVSAGTGGGFKSIGIDGLIIVVLVTVFWLGIAWLTASLLPWRNKLDRVTVAFCLIYMDTTLAIWIADKFFHGLDVEPKLVAIFIMTTVILPVFELFIPREKRKIKTPD